MHALWAWMFSAYVVNTLSATLHNIYLSNHRGCKAVSDMLRWTALLLY